MKLQTFNSKKIFYYTLGIIFLLNIVLSFDAGISGDEKMNYQHANHVIDFFTSFGENDAALKPSLRGPEHYYGTSPDVICQIINRTFNIEDPYQTRHIFNMLIFCCLVLVIGFIIKEIFNWEFAVVAIIITFLTPKLFGHGLNNLKDLPFAFSFVFTFYHLLKLVKNLPNPNFKNYLYLSLGIAMSISIRIGGLLLIPYIFFFVFLIQFRSNFHSVSEFFMNLFSKPNINLYIKLLLACIAGYFIGLILWPFGLINPFKNPITAFMEMEKFSISIGQIFEGVKVPSSQLPWYYLPKLIYGTTPLLVIVGFLVSPLVIFKAKRDIILYWVFFVFVTVFPVSYIIYKHSNVYGCIRHVLFVLPTLVVCSVMGYYYLWQFIKENKILKYMGIAFVAILAFFPIKHFIINHPYQYVYFNKLFGGMETAHGNYETDYYYHSVREATEWLIKNKLDQSKKIAIYSNHASTVHYYTRNYKDYTNYGYARYYERNKKDWDYYICCVKTVAPEQIQEGKWPPKNTVHTIDVDGYPICAIIERKSKADLAGFKALKEKKIDSAIALFNEYLKTDDQSIAVLNSLTRLYLQKNDINNAFSVAKKSMESYKNNIEAVYNLSRIYFNSKNYAKAIPMFKKVISYSPKSIQEYYLLGVSYAYTNNLNEAQKYLNVCINNKYKPGIQFMIQILKSRKQNQQAEKLQKFLNSI
jgi:tetratricopeptide (TPR) repeat protein